ncbi:endolytic transglycosylase MltG [Auritidibacter ignavus]|uniref:endolytic transglycosylase MltG n=1 Tax=Auritidibacter ignavus TaxID=678932 RepID=UPI00109C2E84|nr:endolytic transglycosylase MltG [Auritidibacter ignavus]
MTDEQSAGTGSPSEQRPMTRRERREREQAAELARRAQQVRADASEYGVATTPEQTTQTAQAYNQDEGGTQTDEPAPMTRRQRWAALRAASVAGEDLSGNAPAPVPATEHASEPDHDLAEPEHNTSQPTHYEADQNQDLGDLDPLPQDGRQYPGFDAEESDHDHADDDEDEELEALGYLTVADGSGKYTVVNEEKAAERAKRQRRRYLVLAASFVVFVGLLAVVGIGLRQLIPGTNADYEGPGGEPVTFTVNPGEGPIAIGNRLVEEDIVASTGAFTDALEEAQSVQDIQPGDYQMKRQMSASAAADTLLGIGDPGVNYVAVNSGTRIDAVFESIADATQYSVEEIEEAATDPTAYGLPEQAESLEGYIATGEYRFDVDSSPEEILQLMIEPTMEEFDRLGITDEDDQFDLVTIASILQAEARTDDFETVSGIIRNRLDPSNPETAGYLQIDATVIYGLGTQSLQFTAEDRQDASNEYNTYAHRGLPPGPIGSPSLEALDAAAQPEDNDYYYWVTVNIETGETKFATTLEEHNENVDEYRQYCQDNPEICGGGSNDDPSAPSTDGEAVDDGAQ